MKNATSNATVNAELNRLRACSDPDHWRLMVWGYGKEKQSNPKTVRYWARILPEMKECILERDGQRDLGFVGCRVAAADNRAVTGDNQNRWVELEVWRTLWGAWIVARIEVSQWQGAATRRFALSCADEEDVINALQALNNGRLDHLEKEVLAFAGIVQAETVS